MATQTKPKPPTPPTLPSKEDVKASLPPLGQSEDDEEQGEQTSYDAVRGHLEDAHVALTAAYEELDRLEAANS
jgi:hypothetical protein